MKIMIDYDEFIERKILRKVQYRKQGAEREKTRRKEKQRCENFS